MNETQAAVLRVICETVVPSVERKDDPALASRTGEAIKAASPAGAATATATASA